MSHSAQLRQARLRATPRRVRVLSWLAKHRRPVTAEDVANRHQSLSRMTAFRMLGDFANHGLVQEVRYRDGTRRVEYIGDRPHHHHFVCDHCGVVEHLHLKHESHILQSLKQSHGLKITHHDMAFAGLCRSCQ
ncbi:MAG: transcriptional repressor [Candidatus Kerfeldbacteria bacterium]|nr:transcriptional repressor [Candidatus Kerfeldbacteria bacterium]